MKVLLITPPLVQINTPYPATSFLLGYLEQQDYAVEQRDAGLDLILKIFSHSGLTQIREVILGTKKKSERVQFFLETFQSYASTIDSVIAFLQNKNPTLAYRISARLLLPEGPRFQSLRSDELKYYFGTLGEQDQAKHLASLYIDDLVDVITESVDPSFSLSKYGEKIAASKAQMDDLCEALQEKTLLSDWMREITLDYLKEVQPTVVGLTVPFPGCMLGAMKIAKTIKEKSPEIKIILGGGFVNTELRSIKDVRIFDYVDAITYDDGERPFECLLEYFSKERTRDQLLRTRLKSEKISNEIEWVSDSKEHDVPQAKTGFPSLRGLRTQDYISMLEMLNPMSRFWSDHRWNKLMLAHGCYWKKCNFCDVSLDYIKNYEASAVSLTVERMKRLIQESGSTGFHFIDEAAPPKVLKELSAELINEKMNTTWWGNIRFDKVFDSKLTELMADAGCVAVSGGLEVASNRLLEKMNKGVTVEQVANVTQNFQKVGIKVHAYLMYGFPTETTQETIDSLERVRQLFKNNCIQSAFWHRFSATAHSPIGLNPSDFGIQVKRDGDIQFAENDLLFFDPTETPNDELGVGLRKALYNFMLGIGLDEDVRSWFEFKVPKTTLRKDFIEKVLQ